MTLATSCFKLSTQNQTSIILVLGAVSDAPLQQIIINAAQQLVDKLPVGSVNEIFLLGCETPFPMNKLRSDGIRWMKQHSQRVSLVAPVVAPLVQKRQAGQAVVVISDEPIFDLEDWVEQVKFFLVKSQRNFQSDYPNVEQFAINEISQLVNSLQNPIQKVEIHFEKAISLEHSQGNASRHSLDSRSLTCLPYLWNNPKYFWKRSCLVAEESDSSLGWDASINISGDDEYRPQAILFLRDGTDQLVHLSECKDEISEKSEEKWWALEELERRIFINSIGGRSFNCPICNRVQDPTSLFCAQKDDWGDWRLVYKTLEKYNWRSGFILFRLSTNGQVEVTRPVCQALRLAENEIALIENDIPKTYLYSEEKKAWLSQPMWSGYRQIGANLFGAVLC